MSEQVSSVKDIQKMFQDLSKEDIEVLHQSLKILKQAKGDESSQEEKGSSKEDSSEKESEDKEVKKNEEKEQENEDEQERAEEEGEEEDEKRKGEKEGKDLGGEKEEELKEVLEESKGNIFDVISEEEKSNEEEGEEEASGSNIFDNIVKDKKRLFKEPAALTLRYFPEKIVHRDDEILQLASILSPVLDGRKPSNLIVYGKPGTGKTLCVKFVCNQLKQKSQSNGSNLKIIFLNCKIGKSADTEYRLFAELARNFGEDVPATGLPTQEVYETFCKAVDLEDRKVLLVLDEIDNLVKKENNKNELMYSLTRINSDKLENAEISFIGISNDTTFIQYLDPRTKSSLGEEEFVFSPYNADQLKDLLTTRSKKAFVKGVVDDTVIAKCAAYAARENGDARKALELLRVSAELAERERSTSVREAHVDMAQEKIERDNIAEIVEKQPKQSQIVLYSIIKLLEVESPVESGSIYETYDKIAEKAGLKPLTSRRVSDLIGELDLLGIINTKILYRGRGGRTRQISLAIPPDSLLKVNRILKEALEL